MSNQKDIFEIMKSGGEVRQDHPQFATFMGIVTATLKEVAVMNNLGDVAEIRNKLSEIIGNKIDESTGIFAPFYTNFGKHIQIGKNVFINHACSFLDMGGITIEDDVFIGPNVTFTNDRYPRSKNKDFNLERTHISKGVSIGANSTILPGITIGEESVIGAGSVVVRNVEAKSVMIGNPARKIRSIVDLA